MIPYNTKKVIVIHHYEALFNDNTMTCGISVNLDEFNFPVENFIDPLPKFHVNMKEKKIFVESVKDVLEFINADMELLTYVAKTDKLPILFGRSSTLEVDGAIIAEPLV